MSNPAERSPSAVPASGVVTLDSRCGSSRRPSPRRRHRRSSPAELPGPHRPGSDRRDHLGGQALHLLGVVDERVEQDQLGAGVARPRGSRRRSRPAARPPTRATSRRARSGGRAPPPSARRARCASSSTCTYTRLAKRNAAGSRPQLGERLADHLDLLGELRRRLRAGAEEAVGQPGGAPQRVGMVAADPERRVRPLDGLGLHRRAVELPEAAVEVISASVQHAFITAMPSLKRATIAPGSIPNAANGRASPPVPTPISTRPWLSWSIVAIALARCTGLCSGVTNTAHPSRRRSEQAAA